MKYFIDKEYIDREQVIDLISLGMVNDFVSTVVMPQLEPRTHPAWMSRADMKDRLLDFVGADEPRFWSYAGAPWDWIAIAQLFPVAERVPDGWPYTAHDILQLIESAGLAVDDPRLPSPPPDVHHALADALWARQLYAAATRLLA